MILETCVSSVPQRNLSVFTLNHETEVCMKEDYTIAHIYWRNESKFMWEYVVHSERQFAMEDILAPLFHNLDQIYTVICKKVL
jgi:hypothetical protein